MDFGRDFEARLLDAFAARAAVVPTPSAAVVDRMIAHALLLERWNKTHNLTAAKTAQDYAEALFFDAWLVRAVLPEGERALIDVGAGGGFPSLVLLASEPERQALLFEKVEKKRSFLTMASIAVGAKATRVARSEFSPNVELPDGPRVFVSRATWAPEEWLALATQAAAGDDEVVVQSAQEALPEAPAGWRCVAQVETRLPVSGALRRLGRYAR